MAWPQQQQVQGPEQVQALGQVPGQEQVQQPVRQAPAELTASREPRLQARTKTAIKSEEHVRTVAQRKGRTWHLLILRVRIGAGLVLLV
jgi:hypothetical protein